MEIEMEALGPFKGLYRDITRNDLESSGKENGQSNGHWDYIRHYRGLNSELLVSPLMSPIVLLYILPYITPLLGA